MSLYPEAFQIAAATKGLTIIGDCILVEALPDKETRTKSGLVIANAAAQTNGLGADKPLFVRILLVGEGYYDDNDDRITPRAVPLDSRPGDIVLVGRTSMKPFSTFGELTNYGQTTLGLIRESDIQVRFHGQAGYDRFFAALNGALESQVGS